MGLNDTVSADRVHIAFFGKRNAGKSSVINAVTGQQLSVVSPVAGTTTDPVYKAMELLPLGPVVLIDTAGLDDGGALGALRVKKTQQILQKTDLAILVIDAALGKTRQEEDWIKAFEKRNIPFLTVYNKADLCQMPTLQEGELAVSAVTGDGIHALKEAIAALGKPASEKALLDGVIGAGELAVLVTPIDSAAPKGRLILPQQQTIRALLDLGAMAMVVKETELTGALASLREPPKLVITDSQAFHQVSSQTPAEVWLTSFSILFARQRGDLGLVIEGVKALDSLQEGDGILIAEGCTHHRQCDDIGTVKLPRWIRKYTGREPVFTFSSGRDFPEDLSAFHMVIHCGGCMLNPREIQSRQGRAQAARVPITNYGIAIAYMNGILQRSLQPFPELASMLS